MKKIKVSKILKNKYTWFNIVVVSVIIALACSSIIGIFNIANIRTRDIKASSNVSGAIFNVNEEIIVEEIVVEDYVLSHVGEINGLKYEMPDDFVMVEQGELQLIVKNIDSTYDVCCIVSQNNANIKNNYNVTSTMLTLSENMASHIVESQIVYTDDFEITITEYDFEYPSIAYTVVFGYNVVVFYFYGDDENDMEDIKALADTVISTLSVQEG